MASVVAGREHFRPCDFTHRIRDDEGGRSGGTKFKVKHVISEPLASPDKIGKKVLNSVPP